MNHFESFGIEVGKGRYYEEAVYGAVLVYNVIHNEISTYLKEYDLSPAKLNVMMTIKHKGGKQGISQVDISKSLIVTPSNMTRLLDKLEAEDLVQRFAQEGDRRVNIVKVTNKGSDLLDRVWPGYNKKLQEFMERINKGDQKALSSMLLKWFEVLVNEGEEK